MTNFGGLFDYESKYAEGEFMYYTMCMYAGHIYSRIKVNMVTGMCTLYGYDRQECGSVPMKKM